MSEARTLVRMTPPAVATLGEVAAHLPMLAVSCARCDRHGRLAAARLLRERGAAPDVASDSPYMQAGRTGHRGTWQRGAAWTPPVAVP